MELGTILSLIAISSISLALRKFGGDYYQCMIPDARGTH